MNDHASRRPAFVPGRVRWWQWPTVLSLDAPLVAVTWQAEVMRFGERAPSPRAHHALLLGLAVWLAYAADRWIEAWRLDAHTARTQRHYFYLRFRRPAAIVWLAGLAAGVALAGLRFGAREWTASLALLVPVLAYLLSHQFLHRDHRWRVPKELCVAGLLALGVGLYPAVLSPGALPALAIPVTWFFLLALSNCLLISDWERDVDLRHGQTSLALSHPSARRLISALPWLILALALTARLASQSAAARSVAACAALSACGLGALHLGQARLGREKARVLADLALLSPLLVAAGL